jgi:hypothetical protein
VAWQLPLWQEMLLRSCSAFDRRLLVGDISDEELTQLAGLRSGQIEEFREIFRLFDENGDGVIDLYELKRMMHNLHLDNLLLSDEYFNDLIRLVKGPKVNLPTDGTGNLYFSVRLSSDPDSSASLTNRYPHSNPHRCLSLCVSLCLSLCLPLFISL